MAVTVVAAVVEFKVIVEIVSSAAVAVDMVVREGVEKEISTGAL
jgi:hypothetical protein